jgi:hypothetical protein
MLHPRAHRLPSALIWLQTVGDVSICTLMDVSQEIVDAGSHLMHAWHAPFVRHTVMYDGDTVC